MPRWTLEARKLQSDRQKLSIYQQRPWERLPKADQGSTTGPISAVGKAKAARNSFKHGYRSRVMRELFSRLGRERKALLKKFSENFQ
jgi:hypothetical protein